MKALLLLALVLAAPSALAGVSACPAGAACVSAWSAKDGTCGGAGSERNVVTASAARVGALYVETFCLRANGDPYQEVRVDLAAQGEHVYLGWYNNDGACTLLVHREGDRVGHGSQRHACHGALPPAVPALLP